MFIFIRCFLIFYSLFSQSLDVYLFDDSDEDDSNYVLAQIPLLPLAQGRTKITDTYTFTEVMDSNRLKKITYMYMYINSHE